MDKMKIKKPLILFICLIVLSSFSYGALLSSDVYVGYNLSNYQGINDNFILYNATDINGQMQFLSDGGINGGCVELNAGAAASGLRNLSPSLDWKSMNNGLTVSAWINVSNNINYLGNVGLITSLGTTGGYNQIQMGIEQNSKSMLFIFGNGNSATLHTVVAVGELNDTQWHNIVGVHNASHDTLYVDGIQKGQWSSGVLSSTENSINIGREPTGGYGFTGLIDEVYVFNMSLTYTDVLELNSSFYPFIGDTTPPVINVTFPTPDNASWNIDMWVNFTTDESSTCILNDSYFKEYFSTGLIFSYNETTLPNGYRQVMINCTDDSSNSQVYLVNFTKDKEYPYFNVIYPVNDSTVENTFSIPLNITLVDNLDLYSVQINITDLFNDYVILSGNISYYDTILDTTAWENTSYEINITVCDSHTKNDITPAQKISTNNSLNFKMEYANITIKPLESTKSIGYIKKKDRYTFNFAYPQKHTIKKYRLSSDKKIIYRKNSPFKGHFVINDKYWIDFENSGDVSVVKQGNDWIITAVNSDMDVNFNSLGELNCFTGISHFTLNPITDITGDVFEVDIGNQGNMLFLFFLAFVWLGAIALGLYFNNLGLSSVGFFIGVFLGFFLVSVHVFLTIMMIVLNIVIFYQAARGAK